ncbi:Perlucin [Orchesella cincta]|uniref:Perlucin n=1 Tax=Orchesella cincta TaxID=48709 RepID=A0A1D2N6J6_ORCCI|nr:Perlucin [Orchesella cincta]
MTWGDAHAACEMFCSALAYVEKVEEAKKLGRALKDLMKDHNFVPDDYLTPAAEKKYEYGLDRRYWIGLSDIDTEGTWMWVGKNIKLNYDLWYPAQPDHLPNGTKKPNTVLEHCVVYWYPVFYAKIKEDFPTWNDEPCTNKHYAICDSPRSAAKVGRPCFTI